MRKFNLSFFMAVILISILFSCRKDQFAGDEQPNLDSIAPVARASSSIADRPMAATILGKQKQNPFSVKNMKIALDTLLAYAKKTGDRHLKSAENIKIEPTDLYVRFLPADSMQYNQLFADSTLTLFDIPLDYEIKKLGDYYHDSTVTSPYTWYYTTVKPDYVFPENIKHEILSELFIIEHHPDYTEEDIKDTANLKSAHVNTPIDQDICNALYVVSFKLTGNEQELNTNTRHLKSYDRKCKRRCIWRWCWTSCKTYYYPDGYIKIQKPNRKTEGLKGVKVRMWRWFSYADAITDSMGYYRSKASFKKIWIGNDIYYKIIFKGKGYRSNNRWTFKKTIFGADTWWKDSYGMGVHHPYGHSMTFSPYSAYWGICILNNAVYEYIDYAKKDGVSLPPYHLDIAAKRSSNYTSGAPLLKNHFNFSLVKENPG